MKPKKRHADTVAIHKARQNSSRHWIVVTNHKKAHVYQKTPSGIERVPEECITCSQPIPGEETLRESFPRDLAYWLNMAEREAAFDRLALIAPPETLEEIRTFLEKNVRDKTCAALAREVIAISEDEIEDHIADVAWL